MPGWGWGNPTVPTVPGWGWGNPSNPQKHTDIPVLRITGTRFANHEAEPR